MSHCVNFVRTRSFSGPYFPAFGLNIDQKNSEYGHFSCSVYQRDLRKMRQAKQIKSTQVYKANGSKNLKSSCLLHFDPADSLGMR